MINLNSTKISEYPFPHFCITPVFDLDVYSNLIAEFPKEDYWKTLPNSFQDGRRRIKCNTKEHQDFMADRPTWIKLDEFLMSDDFTNDIIEIYRCTSAFFDAKIKNLKRNTLNNEPTGHDKTRRIASFIEKAASWFGNKNKLYVDYDISNSGIGYWNAAHADRNHRVAIFLIFLCDQSEEQITGGELVLYQETEKAKKSNGVDLRENRSPEGELIEPFATYSLKHNTGVSFLATANAFHGVNKITSAVGRRKFMYVSLSSEEPVFWE